MMSPIVYDSICNRYIIVQYSVTYIFIIPLILHSLNMTDIAGVDFTSLRNWICSRTTMDGIIS